ASPGSPSGAGDGLGVPSPKSQVKVSDWPFGPLDALASSVTSSGGGPPSVDAMSFAVTPPDPPPPPDAGGGGGGGGGGAAGSRSPCDSAGRAGPEPGSSGAQLRCSSQPLPVLRKAREPALPSSMIRSVSPSPSTSPSPGAMRPLHVGPSHTSERVKGVPASP